MVAGAAPCAWADIQSKFSLPVAYISISLGPLSKAAKTAVPLSASTIDGKPKVATPARARPALSQTLMLRYNDFTVTHDFVAAPFRVMLVSFCTMSFPKSAIIFLINWRPPSLRPVDNVPMAVRAAPAAPAAAPPVKKLAIATPAVSPICNPKLVAILQKSRSAILPVRALPPRAVPTV